MKIPTLFARLGDWALVRNERELLPRWVHDPQGSADHFPGGISFHTHLAAQHMRDGHIVRSHDLGSGLVTNVGVLALANEAVTLASPSGARINTLFLANQHFSGKGTTAAAATDIKIETISTNGGQTAVAGTQTFVSAANLQKYQTVATIAYSGTEAVTEWGLHTSATRTATTGSPFTATSATTFTGTSSPYTASSSTVQGLQQSILEAGTTTVWGFVISNTTSVGTIPAWYKVADGTLGSTPGSTETYTIRPVLWDHKVFSAINVVSGDSIQFTYTLTVTSGG